MVRTSSRLRRTGSVVARGGLTKVSVVHACCNVCSEKNLRPHRAMVLALRASCVTCLRERNEPRSVFLREAVGGLVVMVRQLPDGPDLPLLGPFGQASQLPVFNHPLAQWRHGSTSCV